MLVFSTLVAVQLSGLQEFPERTVVAVSCDVSKPKDVQALVDKAARELGRIVSGAGREGFDEAASLHAGLPFGFHYLRQLGLHLSACHCQVLSLPTRLTRLQDVLVCNAALSAKAKTPATASSGEEQAAIVATNLGGPLLCAAAAMKEMQRQPGGGKVFLMDGAGRCAFTIQRTVVGAGVLLSVWGRAGVPACPWLARATHATRRHSFGNCQLHCLLLASSCPSACAPAALLLLQPWAGYSRKRCVWRLQARPGPAVCHPCCRGT